MPDAHRGVVAGLEVGLHEHDGGLDVTFCWYAVLSGDPVLQAVRQAQRRRQVLLQCTNKGQVNTDLFLVSTTEC